MRALMPACGGWVLAGLSVAGCVAGCVSLYPARATRPTKSRIGRPRMRMVLMCPPFGVGGIASRDPWCADVRCCAALRKRRCDVLLAGVLAIDVVYVVVVLGD